MEFYGNYSHAIDSKGRITIPAAYRDALGESFTLTLNGQLKALALYPAQEWQAISSRLDKIPVSDAKGMAYVRMMKAFSYPDLKLDAQSRVMLPATLRSKVGLDKDIVFAGMGTFLEIWDEQRFNALFADLQENLDDVMAYVNERYFSQTE